MKTCYYFLIVHVLCGKIPVEQRQIVSPGSVRLDRRSLCLRMCHGGRTALKDDLPAECKELCPLVHSEVQTRIRKNMNVKPDSCITYGPSKEPVITKSNITVKFEKEANNSWAAIVQWPQLINDSSQYKGYRLTYRAVTSAGYKDPIKCVFLRKNQTQVILHTDKDEWQYPKPVALFVSMYHYNSSVKGAVQMYVYSPSAETTRISAPLLPEKGSYLPIILGILVGVALGGTLLIIIYRRRRRQRRCTRPSPESPTVDVPIKEESYMVSYYPESVKYVERIASIVNWFRETAGYDVIMDKMASNEMSTFGPMDWAERQIRKASKVLVFLSPGYVRLCTDCGEELSNERSPDEIRRVWYEIRLLKNVFGYTHSSAKMVCILMDETISVHDLPPWAEVRYRWPKDRDEILKRLNNESEIAPARIAGNTLNVEEHSHDEL